MSRRGSKRAIVLAAIMVFSVVGTSVAFAGSVSAKTATVSDGEPVHDGAQSIDAVRVQTEPFGVELEQEETVTQGDDVGITAYPNNRADDPVSNATLELVVDADADSRFESDEVVASRTVDFDAGEYRTIELTYENVQLDPGTYQYRAQISKSGQTTTSYTNGTLTVEGGGSEPFDFGVELEQEETVTQGNDVGITAYPNNRADDPVSNTTLELIVDTDANGQFESDEIVANRSIDFNASEYRTVELTYENVQLDPGTYQYRARISKNGETTPSFTNGTLTVEGSGNEPFDFGVELEQEETVTQGDDAIITAYPNNRADDPVSNTTLELVVDADADSRFESDEVVASRSVDFDAGEYRTVELTYENVQLDPGTYQYRAQISKNGESTPSFTNGTLTVENGSDTQRSLQYYTDENGNAGPGDVFDAIDDWRADEISPTLVFEVVSRWRSS